MSPSEPKPSGAQVAVGCLGPIVGVPLRWFAIVQVYRWAIVPLGAPDLPWWQIVAAVIAVAVVRSRIPDPREKEKRDLTGNELVGQAIAFVVAPLLALLVVGLLTDFGRAPAPVVPDWRVCEGVEP